MGSEAAFGSGSESSFGSGSESSFGNGTEASLDAPATAVDLGPTTTESPYAAQGGDGSLGSAAIRRGAPLAPGARVRRFGGTERAVHWIHAAAFFALTGTGVIMYLPALSARIADRPTLKAIHLTAAVAWFTALVVVALVGNRPQLREAVRQLEAFDDDDRRWLLGPGRHRARSRGWRSRIPQGRFNAAEKSHAIVQAALAVLFVLSGVLLWLGERDTAFRLPGTIALHDAAMYVAVVLVLGHLYLALLHPPTRPALRGIVTGEVDAAWAREHHAKWDAPVAGDVTAPLGAAETAGVVGAAETAGASRVATRPGPLRLLLALAAIAGGLAVVLLVVV